LDISQEIIAGCKKGERKAQEKLYKSYYTAMVNLCVRYTRNEHDAIEVLNIAFLKVFNNIQRFDPAKASVYTWIRTIVINSCIDFLKFKGKLVIHQDIGHVSEEIHIDAEAIDKMKLNELLHFIRQLPAATKAVFNLYVMEGYNHNEIGKMLGISEGTSKWHLSEARKTLKQMIRLKEVEV
jgi:RNA polymerase sigma factor (sigma-70 family)